MMTRCAAIIAVMMGLCAQAHAANPSLEDFYAQVPPEDAPAVGMQTVSPSNTPAPPAEAASPSAGSHVVTSVSKCFDDLGAEDAAEIKRNSLTPYGDCQKRLRERAVQKKAAAAAAPVAETPRNYRRVSDDGADDGVHADSPAAEAAPKKK